MRKAQLHWTGRITRMPDFCIPKQLLFGELCQGKRSVGGQRKRFKDSLKTSLKDFSIRTGSWETLATDHLTWRSHIQQGAKRAEEERTKKAEKKNELRKARAASVTDTAPTHMCPTCGRGFHTRISLISHLRTHRSGSSTEKGIGCSLQQKYNVRRTPRP
ncbi:hypothetical protein Pcinc_008347 [Petrolisthes cinctipes]|uniref:C2H2-type domain-containing protein n=1 Tax=Petrolisthes cinctipes TaxID=88211 RepID=A0AAE1G5B6_PETCI|nr:hypothetical protein Pcinc_010299 [Petrolisthes cinctipes]KAK3887529.1 hypothetical protein Pcinc_008347 [Petrolisthes cinctipes]